jgi:Domain of unknown function (DUF4337)
MPDHMEVETDKLREQVDAAREHAGEGSPPWFRYVGLGAAIFAVVAAVSALRAGDLINEATIDQIKASDTWGEYQAARGKEHMYAIAIDNVTDAGSKNAVRMRAYRGEVANELSKEPKLQAEARRLEEDSVAEIRRHHAFEYAVALLQVAIALGAVGALARSRPAWYVSLAAGALGVVFFIRGFVL